MRLFDFAFVPNYPEPLDRLKALAANEHWGKGGRMLKSYFNHMFDKVVEDGCSACIGWPIGGVSHRLATRSDQDIYAVFVPNERDDARDWFFRGFSTRDGLGLGDILQGYEELPVRPRFITRAEQAFYAPQSGVPECDWPRLLAENVTASAQLIHDATDDRILLPDLRDVGKEAYMDCLDEAARRLADDEGMDRLVEWFEAALDRTLDRLHMDYKLAVPHGMPRANPWRWRCRFTCAARCKRGPRCRMGRRAGMLRGTQFADRGDDHNNARLIARPEATWLVEANQVRSKRPTEAIDPLHVAIDDAQSRCTRRLQNP